MDKEVLRKLVESSLSIRQIAKHTGKSIGSIRHWLVKHELNTKEWRKSKASECKFCGETDKNQFNDTGGGKLSKSKCKSCHNKYTIERFKHNKQQAVRYKGSKCVRCGYDKCMGSLHFHHREPGQKDPSWRTMRSWKIERLMAELDKCDLLCANCHGEVHWDKGLTDGSDPGFAHLEVGFNSP